MGPAGMRIFPTVFSRTRPKKSVPLVGCEKIVSDIVSAVQGIRRDTPDPVRRATNSCLSARPSDRCNAGSAAFRKTGTRREDVHRGQRGQATGRTRCPARCPRNPDPCISGQGGRGRAFLRTGTVEVEDGPRRAVGTSRPPIGVDASPVPEIRRASSAPGTQKIRRSVGRTIPDLILGDTCRTIGSARRTAPTTVATAGAALRDRSIDRLLPSADFAEVVTGSAPKICDKTRT